MKRNLIGLISLFAAIALLGLSGCSRTVDDVEKWKTTGNTEKLMKALTDPKIEVRLAASKALGELKAEPAIDALASLYNDSEESVVLSSVESLSQISSPSITTPMIAALKLDYPQARKTAAITLGELKAVGAVEQLTESLNGNDAELQLAAAVSLGQIAHESGSQGLVGQLDASSAELRKTCAISLGSTGGETAARGLIDAMADNNAGVSKAAKQSLVVLGDLSIPFALEGLKNDKTKIRAGSISILKGLDAVPVSGNDLIWYELARASVGQEEGINNGVIQTLVKMEDLAFDTLLEAAAHHVEAFREHASLALERNGRSALNKAVSAAEANAGSAAKSWMAGRGSWPGAPAWRIDLWASLAVLNPQFNLNSATVSSLEMQARPAFNIISQPQFNVQREYIPQLIALLGDTTTPPPEEPDYDADGIPVIKKNRDMFRGEANQVLAKQKLLEIGYVATLPLISAIEDENQLIAGSAADLLGSQGEKRALTPLMSVVKQKLEAGEVLTDSPFYIALQKMNEPVAEPLLLKIRPNPDRAMRIFERKYPGIRPMSSETKDAGRHRSQTVAFRLGYVQKGRVGALVITFIKNGEANWVPYPPLPDKLPL